jgi:UDP-N-acetylmuramoyl-tripeptide--D-alanyl-D-alanine ligase
MSVLWTDQDVAAATGGQVRGAWSVTGLSIDTRTLVAGEMFVALKDLRDGHDFVAEALAKGAGAALVSRVPEGLDPDAPLLVVDDVLAALGALARAARARTGAKVIAVTGSVGKTSTKDMLAHVLAPQGRIHAAEKSYNNHWGVPLTLARMPADADFAVIEIGMNHPGEIAPLTALAAPDVAIVTTVGPVHLEAFADGVPGIAHEKAAIYSGLRAGGVAIYNADLTDLGVSDILRKAADAALGTRAVSFGTQKGADWRLTALHAGVEGLSCAAQTPEGKVLFKMAAQGAHFGTNALAVLAGVVAAGGDLAQSALALSTWQPPAGRGARHFVALDPARPEIGIDLIDDAYNANPSSMGAGLDLLAAGQPARGGRRVAILGDMKELGPTGAALHAALATRPAMAEVDVVHCVGPLMAALHAALPADQQGRHTQDAASMIPHAHHLVGAGDIVLVKGSLSMNMAVLVDAIRKLGHSERNAGRD